MTGRSRRGIRRASTRVRLAIAAAVVVGGGAAGAVAVAATQGGATAVQDASFSHNSSYSMSQPAALSSAMNGWSKSPSTSLTTLSHMTPVRSFSVMTWHHVTLAVQRGTVTAATKKEIVVRSANGTFEVWHLSGGTKTLNVGGSSTAEHALSGGTMWLPAHLNWNVKKLAKGDVVFVFGEKENHTLKAQLVLFAAPVTVKVTPTATATATATPTATATTATPAAATPAPTGSSLQFTGNNS